MCVINSGQIHPALKHKNSKRGKLLSEFGRDYRETLSSTARFIYMNQTYYYVHYLRHTTVTYERDAVSRCHTPGMPTASYFRQLEADDLFYGRPFYSACRSRWGRSHSIMTQCLIFITQDAYRSKQKKSTYNLQSKTVNSHSQNSLHDI